MSLDALWETLIGLATSMIDFIMALFAPLLGWLGFELDN